MTVICTHGVLGCRHGIAAGVGGVNQAYITTWSCSFAQILFEGGAHVYIWVMVTHVLVNLCACTYRVVRTPQQTLLWTRSGWRPDGCYSSAHDSAKQSVSHLAAIVCCVACWLGARLWRRSVAPVWQQNCTQQLSQYLFVSCCFVHKMLCSSWSHMRHDFTASGV